MKILVSNDDGYNAPGIIALKNELSKIAEVTVVAPETQMSATGHSITLSKPLFIKEIEKNYYAVSGTPTDAVKLALMTIMENNPPDYIISGINYGGNLGEDITYSGTVAVALEGALNEIPSIAVSLVVKRFFTQVNSKFKDPLYFETAAKFIANFLPELSKHKLEKNTFLNINVPNLPYEKLGGVNFTSLGRRCYGENVFEQTDPFARKMYWFTGTEFTLYNDKGTDSEALLEDKVSITPLQLDFTNHEFLNKIKTSWNIKL